MSSVEKFKMSRNERIFVLIFMFYLAITYFQTKNQRLPCNYEKGHYVNAFIAYRQTSFTNTTRKSTLVTVSQNVNSSVFISRNKTFDNNQDIMHHFAVENIWKLRIATKIVYNRIPKCGSTTLRYLAAKMRRWNYFHKISSEYFEPRVMNISKQRELLVKLNSLPKPWFYDRHMHFINFTKHGFDMPIYINLVRDPVDRFVSRYYHIRYITPRNMSEERLKLSVNECVEKNIPECSIFSLKYDTFMLIPFFCGHEDFCTYPNEQAVSQAKYNAINYYTVIGLTEKFETFLHVLEYLLPQFFEGIVSFYEENRTPQNMGVKKDILTLANRKKLQDMMRIEYDFYNFLKARFHHLFQSLKLKKQLILAGRS